MDGMVQVAAVGVTAALLAGVLRRGAPEFSLVLVLCAGAWMLLSAADSLGAAVALMEDAGVLESLTMQCVAHNMELMDRLTGQRSFASLLEQARGETNWRRLRAYLGVFESYSLYLHIPQKVQTLAFLYELLMHREGDIRRQAAALMGEIMMAYLRYTKKVAGIVLDGPLPHQTSRLSQDHVAPGRSGDVCSSRPQQGNIPHDDLSADGELPGQGGGAHRVFGPLQNR